MAGYSDRYYKSLYRQQNMPSISLGGAGFTPATFTPMVYTPREFDVAPLQRSLAQLDERKEKTNQQRSAIRLAIGQMNLNEAEDEWKNNYINGIIDKIDKASQFGDYSGALETATDLAARSVVDPQLTSRVRYNENRNKWLENLRQRQARGEINSDTYNRAVAENAYAYQDTYDANGNVVGGIDWNASFDPVKDLDMTQVMREIQALVTPSSTQSSSSGGTSQVYLDKDGNQTTDSSKAVSVFSTSKGGGGGHSETGVTAQQWADAYDAWMNMHREAPAAFAQMRKNDLWNYQQQVIRSQDQSLTQEERDKANQDKAYYYKHITDENGALLSEENYARSVANPMFKVMEYSKTANSSEGGSTLLDTDYLNRKRIGNLTASVLGFNEDVELYGMGTPTDIVMKSAADGRNNVDNNGKAVLPSLVDDFGRTTYVTKTW